VSRHSISALFVLFALAAPAYAQTCGCNDIGDIKRRLAEANAAVQTYSAEMQKMVEQMQRTGDRLEYNAERRQKLQSRVQDALNKVAAGKISTTPTMGDNPGGTSNLCETTIGLHPSATACMRKSVKRHEEHHRQECLKTKSLGKTLGMAASGKDRFEADKASLVQYAMEEIGGYTAEIMFLQGELARLSNAPECKPKPKPKPEVRDYTSQRRERNTSPQDEGKDAVNQGVDSLRRKFGF
jgi:hypothetical protein